MLVVGEESSPGREDQSCAAWLAASSARACGESRSGSNTCYRGVVRFLGDSRAPRGARAEAPVVGWGSAESWQ